MDLMPDDIRKRLLANGASPNETDHLPVVKFFDPKAAAALGKKPNPELPLQGG